MLNYMHMQSRASFFCIASNHIISRWITLLFASYVSLIYQIAGSTLRCVSVMRITTRRVDTESTRTQVIYIQLFRWFKETSLHAFKSLYSCCINTGKTFNRFLFCFIKRRFKNPLQHSCSVYMWNVVLQLIPVSV